MTTELTMLVYSVLLMIVMLLGASLVRVRGWTPAGMALAFGNREESELPEMTPMAARAKRAAVNMMEAMLMFAPVVLAAHAADVSNDQTVLGAQLFFFARVAYFPTYLAGVAYIRTGIWTVGVVGVVMIVMQLL